MSGDPVTFKVDHFGIFARYGTITVQGLETPTVGNWLHWDELTDEQRLYFQRIWDVNYQPVQPRRFRNGHTRHRVRRRQGGVS